MGVDMIPKDSNSTESFQAKVTRIGLFIGVSFHMTIQTRNSRRGECADVTVESSFYFCRRERRHLCICKNPSLGVQVPLKYKVTTHILFSPNVVTEQKVLHANGKQKKAGWLY